MTKKRVLSIRLSDAEFRHLKSLADAAGTSVPLLARRQALETLDLGPRLEAIERALTALPTGQVMAEAFKRLAEKIDRAGGAK